MSEPKRLKCCYIDDAGQRVLAVLSPQTPVNSAEHHAIVGAIACQEDGEIFEIRYSGHPEDYTHTCRSHLGVMIDLSEEGGPDPDSTAWEVTVTRAQRPVND